MVKNQGTKQRGQRILGDCWQWEVNGQCSKGENCSFRHDVGKRAKMTQSNSSPYSFMQQNERNASRTRSPRDRVPVAECLDHARITSKELAPIHSVKSGTLQSACSTSPKRNAECSYAHRQVDEQPSKRSQKNGDKSAVAMLKITRQLGCACFRIWSRRSLHRFCGSAQSYGSQSVVFDSLKLWYVMLTCETRIHRLE